MHCEENSKNHYRLWFVVLAYADVIEIVARFGRYGHAGVAVDRHADVYTLGRKLTELLDRSTEEIYSPIHLDEHVAI